MKKRSFIAALAAMVILTGCSSNSGVKNGAVSTVGGAESASAGYSGGGAASGDMSYYGTGSTSAGTGTASSAAPACGDGSADTGSTSPATSPETAAAAGTDSSSVTSGASAASTKAPEAPATTAEKPATTAGDYTGKDIGGTGKKDFSDDGFFAEADIAVDAVGAAEDGFYVDPTCPVEPVDPIEPVPGWDIEPQAGLLTGGEWNDNDNWDFWQGLYSSNNYGVDWDGYRKLWETSADIRAAVTVRDSAGAAVCGASVSTGEYSAVTNNKGVAYLFFDKNKITNGPTEFTVTYNNGTQKFKEIVNGDCELEFTLDSEAKRAAKTLDLMIMCDTTGSMGDELEYLKQELEDVVTRIRKDNANIPIRLSVNFYRDEGDEYVVREFPFTDDLDAVVNAIAGQSADGGGDTPEAVHTALDSAVNDHDWDENSVKVMFLVLDAPPHEDPQIIDEVAKHIREAAEKGIRIVPVAASGVDKSCEYLLRSMAFMTGGTYAFLTDDSGIGFGHMEPTIGSYDVEKLNDMMVRIVSSYLS